MKKNTVPAQDKLRVGRAFWSPGEDGDASIQSLRRARIECSHVSKWGMGAEREHSHMSPDSLDSPESNMLGRQPSGLLWDRASPQRQREQGQEVFLK